jgi:hypothetical protein
VNTGDGLRIILCVMLALGAAGCASTPTTPAESAPWRRVPSLPGCVGAGSQWDLRSQISIRLQPEFQATLMEQVKQQPLEAPLCWYQISSGDLLLRAGNFCGLSQEAQFHSDGSKWALVRIEHILGQCGS